MAKHYCPNVDLAWHHDLWIMCGLKNTMQPHDLKLNHRKGYLPVGNRKETITYESGEYHLFRNWFCTFRTTYVRSTYGDTMENTRYRVPPVGTCSSWPTAPRNVRTPRGLTRVALVGEPHSRHGRGWKRLPLRGYRLTTGFQAHLVPLTVRFRQVILDQRLEVAVRRQGFHLPLKTPKRLNQMVERSGCGLGALGHGRILLEGKGEGTGKLSRSHYLPMRAVLHLFSPDLPRDLGGSTWNAKNGRIVRYKIDNKYLVLIYRFQAK